MPPSVYPAVGEGVCLHPLATCQSPQTRSPCSALPPRLQPNGAALLLCTVAGRPKPSPAPSCHRAKFRLLTFSASVRRVSPRHPVSIPLPSRELSSGSFAGQASILGLHYCCGRDIRPRTKPKAHGRMNGCIRGSLISDPTYQCAKTDEYASYATKGSRIK